MEITLLTYIYYLILVLNFLVPCDDITWRSRTGTSIKITWNLINNTWITDIGGTYLDHKITKLSIVWFLIRTVSRYPMCDENDLLTYNPIIHVLINFCIKTNFHLSVNFYLFIHCLKYVLLCKYLQDHLSYVLLILETSYIQLKHNWRH